MMTRQALDALVGRTIIIRDFPHICLAAGDDALLLLQIAARDESLLKKRQPVKYIVAHYPEFEGDKLIWGQGEYYDILAYREDDGIPATAKALRDASLALAGRKLSVAMLSDDNGTKCVGVFTTMERAENWLEHSRKADAEVCASANAWVETKHVDRPEKDI